MDAQIPDAILAWVKAHIHSQAMFLLALNVFLLVVGSVVEIGVIFLANLELGFLFPPVGPNLFLSSSRFNKPLPQLYKNVIPFLIILAIGVLLITYVPWMSLGFLELMGKKQGERPATCGGVARDTAAIRTSPADAPAATRGNATGVRGADRRDSPSRSSASSHRCRSW